MIDAIFTIDYELFGDGSGDLYQHMLEPTKELKRIFDLHNSKLVFFVEAAELLKISNTNNDEKIYEIEKQINQLYNQKYEIDLHIHSQWFNAKLINGNWALDYSEYNLSELTKDKIDIYIKECITYLQKIVNNGNYIPTAYRAGGWLIQPSSLISEVLLENNIKIDSSVFKGGKQYYRGLDFRESLKNPYWWRFDDDINKPSKNGRLVQIPIYSRMVPIWKMYTSKRKKIIYSQNIIKNKSNYSKGVIEKACSLLDLMRLYYPKKLDFSKMTSDELIEEFEKIIYKDKVTRDIYKPIVLIGHTKNLEDFDSINLFLDYLKSKNIKIKTFSDILNKIDL